MNNRIKIYVACHKPCHPYKNDVYQPVHVGRALSIYREEMSDIPGDDTGDNISKKNPYYCELTAQYWAWKNIHHLDYIGFCHYRRYFETVFTEENTAQIMGKYDVILSESHIEPRSMFSHLQYSLCWEDVFIFMASLKLAQPQYYDTAVKYMSGNKCIPCNMFVMKKSEFDKYAEWQFSILEEVENHIKRAGYTRMKRALGYMAELLLPIYCLHNRLRIKQMSLVSMPGKTYRKPLKRRVNDIFYNFIHKISYYDKLPLKDQAIEVGLMADGFDAFKILRQK